MPNQIANMRVTGDTVQPVILLNGAPGGPGGANFGGEMAVACSTGRRRQYAIIPAPGTGKRLVVYTAMVQNESATDTTVRLIDIVPRFRALLSQYGWLPLAFGLQVAWKLTENTALTINLSGANSHGYSVQYSIEDV
jgi:hypothetical protein